MASRSDESGPMSDLAQEASRRVGEISHWLDSHEPTDLVDEVKRFARRRPVAFLAIAAAAGVVAGRVTRGAVPRIRVLTRTRSDAARAYDSGAHDYDTLRQAAPRTALAATRTATDAPRYGDSGGDRRIRVQALDRPDGSRHGTATPGSTPPKAQRFRNDRRNRHRLSERDTDD